MAIKHDTKMVMHEIEENIEAIYEALGNIERLLRMGVTDEVPGIYDRAKSYWLAHVDSALLNRGGYLGGSMVSAADTLQELEDYVYGRRF